jgi:Outer membrane protein beta-barrel domain
MKLLFSRLPRYLLIVSAGFALTGCITKKVYHFEPTVKASIDYANTHEHGASEINYDPFIGQNVTMFVKYGVQDVDAQGNTGGLDEDAVEIDNDSMARDKSVPGSLKIGLGLSYIRKGNKLGGTTTHLNYLELPVLLLYHYHLQDHGMLYGGLGPYLAYGLGGKIKGASFEENSFDKNSGGYKRFDAGLEFMAGYKLSMGLSLDLTYDFGLANIAYGGNDYTSKTRCLSLNVGYPLSRIFGRK